MREFQGKDKKALKVKGGAELRQETEKREGAAGWSCFQQQEDESTSNTTPLYIGIVSEILRAISLTFPNLNQTSMQQSLCSDQPARAATHPSSSLIFLSLSFFSFSISRSISSRRSTSAWAFPESSLCRATSCSRFLMRSASSGLAWASRVAF